ncbi:MAG: class I SAM-dependent methyltransferase [Proteobacteria bacterium]|nr:class I SAM-dependent methyltransferase [Pseudomonadota bacterium]MDA1299302.1 class I SAM-dependent methyltransferase [Pseudomonadota bacterium]
MPDTRSSALAHVRQTATRNDPVSILSALDDYGMNHEFLMNVGPEKGPLLAARVGALGKGARVLELGCFCGYSAVLIGSALPEGGTLTGVEVDADSVQVARQMIDYAGLSNHVSIVHGASDVIIPTLSGSFELVFLDHWKDLYKPDLLALEHHQLLKEGSVVFADNVGPAFNPKEYLDYVRQCGHYDTEYHRSHIEYTDREDGIEISIFRAG